MARLEQMRDRLPTLYRPEEGDISLLTAFLQAVGSLLETVAGEAGGVLQSHWFTHADRALFNPYLARSRELQGQPPLDPMNPAHRLVMNAFPYIHDLAHLAALLALPPWEEPPTLRESVEEYRLRIRRIVDLYRNGLGTVQTLRRMIEAQLPANLEAEPEEQDQPFLLEEFAPLSRQSLAVPTRGEPDGVVGPLMRWTVSNSGLRPVAPTLYIQGQEPQEGLIDATANPIVELYHAGSTWPRLGIGYRGTLAPGQTLRLRPSYASWLGRDDGLHRADSLPAEDLPADPTAPGPWSAVPDAPADAVVALLQTEDRALWTATTGELWRYDGQKWARALKELPEVYCLAGDGHSLLLGTRKGLLRMPVVKSGKAFKATPVPGLEDKEVYAIFRAADGTLWLGTGEGAGRLGDSGLEMSALQGTEVYAICQDQAGTLYFGTALGLLQYQPGVDRWYSFRGKEHAEQALDWQPFSPPDLPKEEELFLPPVRCVHRGPDMSLWIGTDNGIARYLARPVNGFTYQTVLEAFPDLDVGPVSAIAEDARGLVWFCTGRGLFRYDGRDWWQLQGDTWVQLGRADRLYTDAPEPPPRGAWRFHRSLGQWQQFRARTGTWLGLSPDLRSAEEAPVRAVLWTDQVQADLGLWDGVTFTSSAAVDPQQLVMRFKPSELRIVPGGLPAVPRLPAGDSTWRYLSMEPDPLARRYEEMANEVEKVIAPSPPEAPGDLFVLAPDLAAKLLKAGERPAWTMEGRLLPPPAGLPAPGPGRYDVESPPPASNFDQAVFAFNPAARVWFTWEARMPLAVLARLEKRAADEIIDPAVLDRVWQGMQQVRPAGVRVALAVEEEIVRGA